MRKLWQRDDRSESVSPQQDTFSPPLPLAQCDPRINDYLDQVCAHLRSSVPPERLAEVRAEIATHLDELIEAHLELGSDPQNAVTAALRQFGSARSVSRRSTPVSRGALRFTAGAFGCFTAVMGVLAYTVALHLGANPLTACLTGPLLPLVVGCRWAHLRESDGTRPVLITVLLGLLASILLPLSPDWRSDSTLYFYAAVTRLISWSLVMCCAAGFVATRKVLQTEDRAEEVT
jgi:hypothetical protein